MWSFRFLLEELSCYTSVSFLVRCWYNIFGDFGPHTSWRLDQGPLHLRMLIPNWASSFVFDINCSKFSPVSDCSTGSIFTSLLTWRSNSVVKFLIWLCNRLFCKEKHVVHRFELHRRIAEVVVIMIIHTLTSRNPETLVYLNNTLRLLVVTSITILMCPFLGVCRSILVFHQTRTLYYV